MTLAGSPLFSFLSLFPPLRYETLHAAVAAFQDTTVLIFIAEKN
jgi:hypothetical protein